MFKVPILAIAILFSLAVQGQNAKNSSSSKTIQSNFSEASIDAYQQSGALKIADYYDYLTLLSDPATTTAFKTEVKAALFSLFKNNGVRVIDFTSEDKNTIPLTTLVEKIENQQYRFLISKTESAFLSGDSWTTTYDLAISRNHKNQTLHCSQKVYFSLSQKYFGATTKPVWSIQLGSIE